MSVFLIAAISADGKIAEREGQSTMDWTSKEDMAFFVKKTKEAGVVVMGRKTFETIGKELPDRLNVVMSHIAPPLAKGKLGGVSCVETSSSPVQIVEKLKKQFKDIAVIGGAEIFEAFLKAGVVTDIFVTIEPHIFGNGIPFVSHIDRIDLELVETQKIGRHGMMLHYRVL